MTKFEHEKRLLKRKFLFILVIAMNEVLIYFMGDEYFFNFKISTIGNWIRIILAAIIILSILYYIKEKSVRVEVKR